MNCAPRTGAALRDVCAQPEERVDDVRLLDLGDLGGEPPEHQAEHDVALCVCVGSGIERLLDVVLVVDPMQALTEARGSRRHGAGKVGAEVAERRGRLGGRIGRRRCGESSCVAEGNLRPRGLVLPLRAGRGQPSTTHPELAANVEERVGPVVQHRDAGRGRRGQDAQEELSEGVRLQLVAERVQDTCVATQGVDAISLVAELTPRPRGEPKGDDRGVSLCHHAAW